jgi:hypothetical protein
MIYSYKIIDAKMTNDLLWSLQVLNIILSQLIHNYLFAFINNTF